MNKKPWTDGGRVMLWTGKARPLQSYQVVVLDRDGLTLWAYDHDACIFTGLEVRTTQLQLTAIPPLIERLIAMSSIEEVLKTPGLVIRSLVAMTTAKRPASSPVPHREMAPSHPG